MNLFEKITSKRVFVFIFLWLLLFIIYLPAAKAGFVMDFTGWMDQLVNHSFWEYENRTNFFVKSLYQFTQLVTYIFFKLFGTHRWLWHLLHLTLQSINGLLIFIICKKLFLDAAIKYAGLISFAGVILFCICPHISEVVVWEPAYHYLQGLLIILLIIYWTQCFLHNPNIKYAWYAGILFFLSTFSLEIFYLTPFFVLLMAFYYRHVLQYDKVIFKKVIKYFFIPFIILFIIHLASYRLVYGGWLSHVGNVRIADRPLGYLLSKPLEYIFHILFLGRFFSYDVRQKVYSVCESKPVIILFWSCMLLLLMLITARFKQMNVKWKTAVLLFFWTCLATSLVPILFFPALQLLAADRYTYLIDPFIYMLMSLLLSFITYNVLRWSAYLIFAIINLNLTLALSRYWKYSSHIVTNLLYSFPDPGNKIVVLLSMPENMHGVPMIGAAATSEFKLMHNLLAAKKYDNITFDAESFNMENPTDGSHVNVINDSTVRVTLNQWGTWWWRNSLGGVSYQNDFYRLNMVDQGHFYELTLKKPADAYLLLYQVGDQWKIVDWNKKNIDQN